MHNAHDWQVDGLATSVGSGFQLSMGAIARSILEAAGPEIQQELNSKSRRGVRAGDVVVTRGHRLNASFVFHGVLKAWHGGLGDAEAVSSVLIETEEFLKIAASHW